MFKSDKMIEPMARVYNSKARINEVIDGVNYNDDEAIKEFCRATFATDGQIANPSQLWDFNTALVRTAEMFYVKPNMDQILNHIATTETVDANTSLKVIKIPKEQDIKFTLSASGSGSKLQKIGNEGIVSRAPFYVSLGLTYDVLTKTEDEVAWFKKAVEQIGRAKLTYIFNKINDIAKDAVSNQTIPAKNVIQGSGAVTYKDVVNAARVLRRRTGKNPVLLADEVLLDHIAEDMAKTSASGGVLELLTDPVKDELFSTFGMVNFGKFTGVVLENHFTNENNTGYQFDVGEGIMFGSGDVKPYVVSMIGTMVQTTDSNIVNGMVQMWVGQEMAIELLYPNRIVYIQDDAIVG